jgi:hypothetical protein
MEKVIHMEERLKAFLSSPEFDNYRNAIRTYVNEKNNVTEEDLKKSVLCKLNEWAQEFCFIHGLEIEDFEYKYAHFDFGHMFGIAIDIKVKHKADKTLVPFMIQEYDKMTRRYRKYEDSIFFKIFSFFNKEK